MDWPWSRQRQVDCGNNRMRFVFKNIDHAFPFYFKEAKASVAGTISGLHNLKGKIGAQYEEKIHHLLVKVNENNASVQSHLRAAYVLYMAAPCEKLEYLEAAIEAIRQDERNLRRAEVAVQNIKGLLGRGGRRGLVDDATMQGGVGAHFESALKALDSRASTAGLIEEMGQVARNAVEWQKT
jgi:hypothetical protein